MRALSIFLLFTIGVISLYSIEKFYYSACTIKKICYSLDTKLSAQAQKEIEEYCSEFLAKSIAAPVLVEKIKNKFPFLRSIKVQLEPVRVAYCSVRAYNPEIIVNNKFVYGNLQFFDIANFAPHFLRTLSSVNCLLSDYDSEEYELFLQTLKKISPELCAIYAVTIYNQEKIKLVDKEQPQCIVICDVNTIPNKAMQALCKTVVSMQYAKKSVQSKSFIADVRFKDQIILHETGGA